MLQGSSIATRNDGSIVSFVVSENDIPITERCNERHDFYQDQLRRNAMELANFVGSHGRSALLKAHKKAVKGAKEPCVLRSLSRFDVGRSFVFDSLHNLYLGLFVSRSFFSNLGSIFSNVKTASLVVAKLSIQE